MEREREERETHTHMIQKQSSSNIQTQDPNMLAFRLLGLCTHSKMKHHLCIYKSKKTCGMLMCKSHCMK